MVEFREDGCKFISRLVYLSHVRPFQRQSTPLTPPANKNAPTLPIFILLFRPEFVHLQVDCPLRRALEGAERTVRRPRLKCDGTRAETRFRLSAKRTSTFKSAGGASVQSTTGSRGVRISGSNAGYTMFRGSVKGTGYPLHSPVSRSLPLTVRHRVPSHFN